MKVTFDGCKIWTLKPRWRLNCINDTDVRGHGRERSKTIKFRSSFGIFRTRRQEEAAAEAQMSLNLTYLPCDRQRSPPALLSRGEDEPERVAPSDNCVVTP